MKAESLSFIWSQSLEADNKETDFFNLVFHVVEVSGGIGVIRINDFL